MKALFLLVTVTMLIFSNAHGQETNIKKDAELQGPWILENFGTWIVRNKNGTILPLSFTTTLYDCGKKITSISKELNGYEVKISYFYKNEKDTLPEIETVFLICK